MVILEITPVEGSFGEFGELAHRIFEKWQYPLCQRMPLKDFLKKVQKSGNAFKNSGNIPDVADFFQKAVLFSDFLAIYPIKPERFQNFWKYT